LFEFLVVLSDVDGRRLESHLLAEEPKEALLPSGLLLLQDESVDKMVRGFRVVLACNQRAIRTMKIILTFLLGSLALSVVLVGKNDKLSNTAFQTKTFLVSLLPDVFEIIHSSRKPDSLDGSVRIGLNVGNSGTVSDVAGSRGLEAGQTRDGSAKLLERRSRVVFLGNVDQGDGSSSSKREVLSRGKPLLSDSDIVVVLSPDEEERPVDQDEGDEEVGDMSTLVEGRDVTESELVESIKTGVGRGDTKISSCHKQ
jgi:hypothetical protein